MHTTEQIEGIYFRPFFEHLHMNGQSCLWVQCKCMHITSCKIRASCTFGTEICVNVMRLNNFCVRCTYVVPVYGNIPASEQSYSTRYSHSLRRFYDDLLNYNRNGKRQTNSLIQFAFAWAFLQLLPPPLSIFLAPSNHLSLIYLLKMQQISTTSRRLLVAD